MNHFLQTVAEHYFKPLLQTAKGPEDYLQITEWMFVFPNRRAGLFFNYHLCQLNDNRPLLSPRCITIGDLFSLFSDYRVADRTELLFRLYKIYNEVRAQNHIPMEAERFENFIFWGEMMLRDFDEVDKYLVEADKLFYNVRDLKEIDDVMGALDPEVLEIIRTFWKNVDPGKSTSGSVKENFTYTWSILFEVYSKFRQALSNEGLAYEGMRQREVVERLPLPEMEQILERLPKHIVLVGITAINRAERELLLWLQKRGILECCWDYADANVQDIRFVKENLADFGNALTDEEQQRGIIPVEKKKLSQMSIPSGVGQAAEAARILQQWCDKEPLETAVVLSDENLLHSMLYNMPASYPKYNVTMGCSLRSTPVATLVDALIFLQHNIKFDGLHTPTYYYKAVLPLLSHAFLLELEGTECSRMHSHITRQSLYQVPESELQGTELFRYIFRQVRPIDYLRGVLMYLLQAFKPAETDESTPLEELLPDRHILNRECLIVYLQMLEQLETELHEVGMEAMDFSSQYHLIQKLSQGLSVSYSGEPMMGLQMMGVLETRAIDFERMVVLSMNEGVVPAKPSQNSFIPHTLREAFQLPTQIYKDLVFAYHFYRMISRASEVVFLYDSRTDGMQTGEPSRYLMQMKYLTNAEIQLLKPHNHIVSHNEQSITVEKTPLVREQLDAFRKGNRRYLSASVLKTYIDCPLQFYFAHVMNLSSDDELEDEMDDSQFGTILHDVLKRFYDRFVDHLVLSDVLREAIQDPDLIMSLVKEAYLHHFKSTPDNGYQQLVCTLIANSVKSILQHDMKEVVPFRYLSGECTCKIDYQVDADLVVQIKSVYDRLDIRTDEKGELSLRIVDYKTGNPNDKVQVGDIHQLFAEDSKCSKEAFQVLFYCLMLEYASDGDRNRMHLLPLSAQNAYRHVEPHLYFTRMFMNENMNTKTQLLEDFMGEQRYIVEEQMRDLIREIFSDSPFVQTEKTDKCKNCKFVVICNKNNKDE